MPDDGDWGKVQLEAEDDGVVVIGADDRDQDDAAIALIPWDQAVAVARQIIELARSRGDLT